MKIKYIITLFLFLTSLSIYSQTINGRVVVVTNDGSTYSIKLQINSNESGASIGTSTFVMTFDDESISIPASPIESTDYSFFAFSSGSYSAGTVTKATSNQIRINLELATVSGGTIIAQSPSWSDLVQINFTTVNSTGHSNLKWVAESMSGEIFGDDDNTEWSLGSFTDEDTMPLPVELVGFDVNLTSNGDVQLRWETVTETNNYGFEIERKLLEKNGDWEKLFFIEGAGSSSIIHKYSYVDSRPLGGSKFQYRLKQIDLDGTYEYSKVLEVNLTPEKYSLDQNYPNPFNPSTTIRFSLPIRTKLKINVFDALGKLVAKLADQIYEAGSHQIRFDASYFTNGVYIYTLESSDYYASKKMILLK